MLALEVELLTGRYVATRFNSFDEAEWPPHPARVFSALVATHFAASPVDTAERAAIEWLQQQSAPEICASDFDDTAHRSLVEVFVPTNDNKVPKKETQSDDAVSEAVEMLPGHRRKRSRTFPSVAPANPLVYFVWRDSEPSADVRASLSELANRVTRVGHSSSLVRCTFVDAPPDPTWVPDPDGPHVFRAPGPNQLAELEAAYAFHLEQRTRLLPYLSVRYRSLREAAATSPPPAEGVFGVDWIVWALGGQSSPPVTQAADVATALRRAAIEAAGTTAPEILTGLTLDGSPSAAPHVAFVALPHVGVRYADGNVRGVAAVLPRALVGEERRTVLRALGRVERISLPSGRTWTATRVIGDSIRALRPSTWCGSHSERWATVTPILLDRFPGDLSSADSRTAREAEERAAATIALSCKRIGLPEPIVVSVEQISRFSGVPPARQFASARHGTAPARVRVHAVVDFGRRVKGPVLLGAGRYVGLGLCRPVRGDQQ